MLGGGIDWTAISMALISGLLSVGAIGVFLARYMPMVIKYATLAKDAVETLNDIAAALKPDANGKVELTPQEIDEIKADAEKFQIDLKLLHG